LVVLCETNVSNLISQRLDTIYQIKPKCATVLFLRLFAELNTPNEWDRAYAGRQGVNASSAVCLLPWKGRKGTVAHFGFIW
jgi:hypothetical protein